jgi:hypothetical protein
MKRVRVALWAAVPSIGLVLGLATHANAHLPEPYGTLSSLIGWTYFAAWSVSHTWPPPWAPSAAAAAAAAAWLLLLLMIDAHSLMLAR